MEGRSSYELEFPNGGIAYVIGNIIEQSRKTENQDLVSFGAEGYRSTQNEIYLVSNTLVDDLPRGGNFVRIREGANRVVLINNLLVGSHGLNPADTWELVGNTSAGTGDVPFASLMDYRLAAGSPLVGVAVNPDGILPAHLSLRREYVHPMQSRALAPGPRSPGALQSLVH